MLLDQNVPMKLMQRLRSHEVQHVYLIGWDRLQNGDLIRAAEQAGYDALLSCDQNIAYQQNLRNRRISVLLLSTNHWPTMRNFVPAITAALQDATPGSFHTIECGRFVRGGR